MASRSLGVLSLDLIAKTGGFTEPLDKAARNTKKNADSISSSAAKIGASIGKAGAAIAAVAATAAFATIIQETKEFQQEQAQLAAALDSTNKAAGYTQATLNSMADTLSKGTGIDGGEITKAQTALLAFTKIVGDQYPKALQAAADISARKGTEISDAVELVGKALDSPTKGLAALSKQGIRFSEDQKKVIESLEETGRVAEAQEIILGELEKKFGGAAKAARNTFGGALTGLQSSLKDFLTADEESFSGAAAAINELTDTLNDPQVKAGISSLVSGLASIASAAVITASKLASITAEAPSFFKWLIGDTDTSNIGAVINRMSELEEKINKVSDGTVKLNSNNANYYLNLTKEYQRLELVVKAYEDKKKALQDDQKATAEAAEAMRKVSIEEQKRAEAAEKSQKKYEENQKFINDRIAALKLEADTIGMAGFKLEEYGLKLHGATKAQIEAARSAYETVEAYKQIASEMAELDSLSMPSSGGSANDRLNELSKQFESEREVELARFEQQKEDYAEYIELKGIQDAEAYAMYEQMNQEHQDRMRAIDTAGLQAKLGIAKGIFGNLSTLMNTESKRLFEIGKIAALSGAIVSGISATIDSYAAGAKIGGPALGAAFAASAAIATGVQIAAIRNAKFGGGASSPAVSTTQSINNSSTPVGATNTRDVYLHGIDPNQLYSGSSILSLLNNELMNGGRLAGVN